MLKPPAASSLCPCGRRTFGACCGPLLAGAADAADAESLMRSRYTAFALGDAAYLLATWHPDFRPGTVQLDAGDRWLGLDVRSHCATGPDRAEVEFVARCRRTAGRASRLHELSRFVREAGRWYYTDGDAR